MAELRVILTYLPRASHYCGAENVATTAVHPEVFRKILVVVVVEGTDARQIEF